MSGCTPEMAQELERWLEGDHERRERSGEAQGSSTSAVGAHLELCGACRAHLDWLRTERALFAARARADRAAVPDFEGVLARMQGSAMVPMAPARERARRALVDGRAFALSLCAAAALLCVAIPQRAPEGPMATPEPRSTPGTLAAGTPDGEGLAHACAELSCCSGEDTPCAEADGDGARIEPASPATSPEASTCSDGSCRSPDDHTPDAHARIEQRNDLTCSEDL